MSYLNHYRGSVMGDMKLKSMVADTTSFEALENKGTVDGRSVREKIRIKKSQTGNI